jgi:ligand-binding sensor domain-containing protein
LNSWAQTPHPTFKQYTVEDGLANSDVYQVKQDSKGYIWFATGNGVSRFNGYEFENFSMSNGLPDNTVFEIFEDHAERIWFVPISCKLSYYFKGKIYTYKYNKELLKLIKNPLKTSFSVDEKGTVFLGIYNDGIYKITIDGEITHLNDSINDSIGLFVIEPIKDNYVFSKQGTAKSYSLTFDTQLMKGTMQLSINTSNASPHTRIIKTKKNKIVIAYGNYLVMIDQLNKYTIETFPNSINWLYEDSDEDLWIGTYFGGVYQVSHNNFTTKKRYFNQLSVNGILQDREGGFWMASEGNGVYYMPSKYMMTFDKEAGLTDNRSNCLAVNNHDLFLGLQNGYVQKITAEKVVSAYDCNMKEVQMNAIYNLFYDYDATHLSVAANLHSGIIDNEKFTSSQLAIKFNKILIDSNRKKWYTSSSGIHQSGNDQFRQMPFNNKNASKRVNAILEQNTQTLYLGCIDGLWTYNYSTNVSEYIGMKDSLLQNRILDLAYTTDSLLVIATKGVGILIYDKKNAYKINAAKGLCGDNVYHIRIDGKTIWAATNRGLNSITISSSKPLAYTIRSYTTIDGLASNEVNDVIQMDNKIWVATNKGLSMFNPEELVRSSKPIPLFIQEIAINDRDTIPLKKYNLSYTENNIKIKFIALGYQNAGKLKYRYKMLGLDTNWVYTQNREIQFTTLPANNYTFLLAVLNPNGVWSKNEVRIAFTIRSPFWQKWWFIALCMVSIFLIIAGLFKYRIKKNKAEEEKSMNLNRMLMNLRLKALRAQMNPHFTFNVMNSIQHFIINKDSESANRYLSKFSKLIRIILNNSEKNTIPIIEELKALELYLELESMRFEERFDYEILLDPLMDGAIIEIPSMLIQPYIENSVKHGILPSKLKGKIIIELQQQGTILKCVIEDNGIGRAKAAENNKNNEHQSYGTSITQERLAVINELNQSTLSEKIIDLYDEHGNGIGTRVEIYIPINETTSR